MDQRDDEFVINGKTWNKLHERATKSGNRDGISDGRESNFQKSFDEGYQQGFKNGFALGLYKGALRFDIKIDETLQKISQGNCIICKDKSLEESPVADLISLQTNKTNNILNELCKKHQGNVSIGLPDKLN